MNFTALFRALKFACIPTLSVLVILFFGFFSINETLAFISSNNGWAIFIRIACMIGELVLIAYFYEKYRREEILTKYERTGNKYKIYHHTDAYQLFKDQDYKDYKYYSYETADSDIMIIEREYKPKND